LQKTRETLRRRRKAFQPRQLSVYVDDAEVASFDPARTSQVQLDIDPDASVIEVRGDDAHGALILAALIVCCDDIPSGEMFKDRAVLEGGQRITIQMIPSRSATEELESLRVEINYAETSLRQAASWYAGRLWRSLTGPAKPRREASGAAGWGYSQLLKAGAVVLLLLAGLTFIWIQLLPTESIQIATPRVETPPPPDVVAPPQAPPAVPPVQPPVREQTERLIADTRWSRDPEAARQAIRLETLRGEINKVEIPRDQRTLLIAIPQTDAGNQAYTRYRITLLEAGKAVWQLTLRPPERNRRGHAHILNLTLSRLLRDRAESFALQFDGVTQTGWQSLGSVTVQLINR
jgi:hypothetical protein